MTQRARKPVSKDVEPDGVPPEPDPADPAPEPVVPPEPDPAPAPTAPAGKYTLLNPGTTPVVYTVDGRIIAAGERISVDSIDSVGQTAIDRGYLKLVDSQ